MDLYAYYQKHMRTLKPSVQGPESILWPHNDGILKPQDIDMAWHKQPKGTNQGKTPEDSKSGRQTKKNGSYNLYGNIV